MAQSSAHILDVRTGKPASINIGMTDAQRKAVAKDLSKVLGDTYTLLVKTHVYHWNVVGPLFVSLHELFEKQYEDLFKATDTIAERIRALGHPSPVSFKDMNELATIGEAEGVPTAEVMVAALVADHEAIIQDLRAMVSKIEEDHDDPATADMLIGRMDVHAHAIWMLRAIITT